MPVRVISYTRFSTRIQAKGQSLRRQEEKAEEWAEKNGYILDDSLRFRDLGVSAWSGANAETGALAQLLGMVRSGQLEPGSILLVEAMDRLTRQGLDEAIPLFLELLKSGIEIVTLQDSQCYNKETLQDQGKFILAIVYLSGANKESETKSTRVRDAYKENRDCGSSQIFGSAPGWLQRKDKFSPWEVVPDKVEVVRKVFELVADGWGSGEIAKKANKEGWVIPTRLAEARNLKGWTSTMAGKLVRNRAVIGEHEHRDRTRAANKQHWEGVSRGIVRKNYYPAIVDEDLFYRVQAAVDRRRKPQGRDQWYLNIWSGLICCGTCGGGVWRKSDPKTSTQGQLRCRNAAAGLCTEPSIPVKQVDVTLLNHIAQFSSVLLGDVDTYIAKLDAELVKLKEVDTAAANLGAVIKTKGVNLPVLVEQATELSIQRATLSGEIEHLRKLIAERTGNLFDTSFADNLLPLLYERSEAAKDARAKANLKLRRLLLKDKGIALFARDQRVALTYIESRDQFQVDLRPSCGPLRVDEDTDSPFPVDPNPPGLENYDEKTLLRLKKFLS